MSTILTKKRAILLSICGASTYQLIRNLVAPAKPTSKSFDDLVKLVKNITSRHHQSLFNGTSCTSESVMKKNRSPIFSRTSVNSLSTASLATH